MPTIDDLLAHAGWARGLARALCADSSAADDLLQQTWQAALTRGPRSGDSPRGWLAAVLRNFARQAHRTEAARAVRERRVARPEPAPGAEDVLARAQLHERVSRAVLELDEPYRGTVLWCYFDGLSPDEIAAREGCPAATVRSRLKRALQQLRQRLDREFGRREDWLAALVPLAHDLGPAASAAAGASILGGVLVSKKLTFSLTGLALLLLAGWGTVRMLTPRASERTEAPEPPAALASSASPDDSAEIASASPSAERANVLPGPMLSPAAPLDPQAPLGWIEVLAIDASTREPIPGAEILWAASELDSLGGPTPWKAVQGWIDAEAFFEEHGRAFVADAKGRAKVPRATYGFAAAARAKGMWAIRSVDLFDTEVDPLVLALEPDPSLEVQVLGEDGKPVGDVPVVLQAKLRASADGLWGWGARRVLVTDAVDGRARLHHPQFLRHTRDSSPTLMGWRLVPPTAAREAPLELDPRNLPSEPIRFHLGASGELEVVLQDVDGRVVESDDDLFLQFRKADGQTVDAAGFSMTRGRILLRGIGLGLTVEASSYFPDSFASAKGSGAGPREAGERARLAVTQTAARFWYEGRIVRADGRPLSERAVEFDLLDEPPASVDQSPRTRSFHLRTDERGVFRAPAPEPYAPGSIRTAAIVLPSVRRVGEAGRRILLASEPSPGRNWLGDVAVEALPLVASGRVVDQDGRSVPHVTVSAWAKRPGGPRLGTHPSISAQGRADGEGCFELRGMIVGGPITLQASGADELQGATSTEVGLGSSGVTLLLVRGGSIAGRLILPPGLVPADVEVHGLTRGRGEPMPDQDGAFLLESVPAGVHALEVRARRQSTVLLSIPGVAVEPGRRTELGDIAVPASGRWIELRVVRASGESGSEAPGVHGYYRVRGGPTWSAEPFENGKIRVLARDEPLDVEIAVPGMRPVVLEGVTEDRTVRVEAAIPLRFVLERFEPLAQPAKLGLVLWPADRPMGDSESFALERGSPPQLEVDARGEVALTAPWPGRYGVDWRVYRQLVREWDAEHVSQQPILYIDVPEGAGELEIRTSLDPAELAAAVKRLLSR